MTLCRVSVQCAPSMTLPKNGAVYKWLAGFLALAALSSGGIILGHETRLTKVETLVAERLRSIEATLARLEAKMDGG